MADLQRKATVNTENPRTVKLAKNRRAASSLQDRKKTWTRLCVHIPAFLIDLTYNFVLAEECYGACLDDGTELGPSHQRTLFESRENTWEDMK